VLLLAARALLAQDSGSGSQESHGSTFGSYQGLNPYVVAADTAYAKRQEGRVGAVASPRRISEAIAAYQTAAEAADNLEAHWKLLRAFYFKGAYTGLDLDARKVVFSKARAASEDVMVILARRAGRLTVAELAATTTKTATQTGSRIRSRRSARRTSAHVPTNPFTATPTRRRCPRSRSGEGTAPRGWVAGR